MNAQIQKMSLLTFVLFLAIFSFGQSSALAGEKNIKRDIRVAKKVIQKTQNSLTTTININNSLVSQLRGDGSCSGEIISQSPGWSTGKNEPSEAEFRQTAAAEAFAFLVSYAYSVKETAVAGQWTEGTLRSASKWRVRNKNVRAILRSQANVIAEMRKVAAEPVDICTTLQSWKDNDYKGIYSLVNASWGEDGFQAKIKKLRDLYKPWYRSLGRLFKKVGSPAFSLYSESYSRAIGIYYNSFYKEVDKNFPQKSRGSFSILGL